MTKAEMMLNYGLTDEDMIANVETLSDSLCHYRFIVEFGGSFGCFETGDYGYFDGQNFRIRPESVTEEEQLKLIKDSLKEKKNLFLEKWNNVAHFRNDVEY